MVSQAFVTYYFRGDGPYFANRENTWVRTSWRTCFRGRHRTTREWPRRYIERPSFPSMIQSPDTDGPPGLSAFFDRQRRSVGTKGAPISVGTGRATCDTYDGDAAAAATAALDRALEAISQDGDPQLCHCTLSLDVDVATVQRTLSEKLRAIAEIPLIGRTINKKESQGTIEVMLLRSDEGTGISIGECVRDSQGSDDISLREAAMSAANEAASSAMAALKADSGCTFLIFACTPGAPVDAMREEFAKVLPGVIAYGGPGVGTEETGMGWALMKSTQDGLFKSSLEKQYVCVAAVPGCINFLISSVVKNWAQPTYAEPLSYMIPTYVGDPSIDLLTAIRYDDWDKFLWCFEDQGVDVNTLWPEKQNQSPLLAACARVRPRMIEYMIRKGANVHHRNAGGFTAVMYTRKLIEYDPKVLLAQLKALHDAGLDTNLSPEDEKAVRDSGDGRIFLDRVDDV